MADIIAVTADFAVAPQLNLADFQSAAAAGYWTVICNRPDNEAADQPTAAQSAEAARAAGLAFYTLPFAGPPPRDLIEATARILNETDGPILSYCRSGTRSITVWAFAQVQRGAMSPDEAIQAAQRAGYDLSAQALALQRWAGN